MKKLISIVSLWLLFALPAWAENKGMVIWLGDEPQANALALEEMGYRVLWLQCEVISLECLKAGLRSNATQEPIYLITTDAYSDFVRKIYHSHISAQHLAGIAMMRARQVPEIDVEVQSDAPALLVMVAGTDSSEQIYGSRIFTTKLRRAGAETTFLFVGKGAFSGAPVPQMTLDLFAAFTGNSPFADGFNNMLKAYKAWEHPLISYEEFYEKPDLISTQAMSDTLKRIIGAHYDKAPHQMAQWAFEDYTSFNLLAYRDLVAPGKRYATIRNVREQVIFLDLEKYAPYEPEIVLGVDDEANLYQMAWFYQTLAMYSWLPGQQNISVRLLGPFLYFRKELDMDLGVPLLLRSALSLEGITFSDEDPLKPIETYPEHIQRVITVENKCIYCHEIEGFGGRYHHIDAMTMEPQGGIALPLVEYPPEVMNAFLFDQVNTAKKIGMTPNPLKESVATPFHAWWKKLVAEQSD
jgi:hypothetical protein